MTVNERLVTAGLVGQFDAAIGAGDRHRAMDLLRQVAMSESSAAATVDAVLADPSRYAAAFPREHNLTPLGEAPDARWTELYRGWD